MKIMPISAYMRKEYENLIESLDKLLSDFRTLWMSASNREDARKWMDKINERLDERLRLMQLRDSST